MLNRWLENEPKETLICAVTSAVLMPLGQPTPYTNAGFADIQPRHSSPRVL